MQFAAERFQGRAGHYAGFRPAYPERLVRLLTKRIAGHPPPPGGIVADVGSGTGIFTRQLRAHLPRGVPVIGIEPASDMRREAEATFAHTDGIEWIEGAAENLPMETRTARAVVAATAAHWFDRPVFLAEAHRVLMRSGVLAIIEYVRDMTSPAAAAAENFLRHHGGPRAYAPPDYDIELRQAPGFHRLAHRMEPVTMLLSREAFVGLALSSSHARSVTAALGREAAENLLFQSVRHLVSEDGSIPFGYRFHLFMVRRTS